MIVGAPYWDGGQPDEGGASVYLGSPTGLSSAAAWSVESDQGGSFFGYSVASAGDVNGDGYSDVLIGAFAWDGGHQDEGRATLYLGSPVGLDSAPSWFAEADQFEARFGVSVASAGDVNSDGYGDILVGSYLYDGPELNEGRVFVYLGGSSVPSPAPDFILEGDVAGAEFGLSVASAGDVNGDGYGDVIVGARNHSNGQTWEGRAYVYRGSSSGIDVVES